MGSAANASQVTDDFTVYYGNTPYPTGSVSIDSSTIASGEANSSGGTYQLTGNSLLTTLSFDWQGTHYDAMGVPAPSAL